MATGPDLQAQLPVRSKGQTTCAHHSGQGLPLMCETCNELVCLKCLSLIHQGHVFCELNDIIPAKKEQLITYIDETEKTELTQVQLEVLSVEQKIKETSDQFGNLIEDVKKQGEKMKEETDRLTAKFVSLYQQMEEDNVEILTNYRKQLTSRLEYIEKQLHENRKVLQCGSNIDIFDSESQFKQTIQPKEMYAIPALNKVNFIVNENPAALLEKALGTILSIDGSGRLTIENQQAASQKKQQEIPSVSTSEIKCPLPKITYFGKFRTPNKISSVSLLTDGNAWTCTYKSNMAMLLDRSGTVLKQVQINTNIDDISVSPTTQNLWMCSAANRSIMELVTSSGIPAFRFNAADIPSCLCVTADEHIIVGMPKKIIKYTSTGKTVLTTKSFKPWNQLVHVPLRISECHITQNIAVCDVVSRTESSKDYSNLLVLDKNFKELFRFREDIPPSIPSSQHPTQFFPVAVMYDNVGNLVFAEKYSNCLHFLNGIGENHHRLVNSHTEGTRSIGIDRNNVMWAVISDNKVKLLNYSNG